MNSQAAIYIRVSDKSDEVNKVENQERRLRALAKTSGHDVVEVFVDDDISAHKGKRFVRVSLGSCPA